MHNGKHRLSPGELLGSKWSMCAAEVTDEKLLNCCNDPKLNPVPQSDVTNCFP